MNILPVLFLALSVFADEPIKYKEKEITTAIIASSFSIHSTVGQVDGSCVGLRVTAKKGGWTQIKEIRENAFFNMQGEAMCLAVQHLCKQKCVPLVITEQQE